MTRGLLTVLCVTWLLGGCTSQDSSPVFLDMEYQVRCITCEPRSPDNEKRSIMLLDGEEGHSVRCRIGERSGDRFLTFSMTFIDEVTESKNYGLDIFEANIDDNDPGNTCEVTVREGNNTYKGECTGSEPDEDATCQLEFAPEGDILRGSVLCLEMTNQVNNTTFRRVVKPGKKDEAADFEIHGCSGL